MTGSVLLWGALALVAACVYSKRRLAARHAVAWYPEVVLSGQGAHLVAPLDAAKVPGWHQRHLTMPCHAE